MYNDVRLCELIASHGDSESASEVTVTWSQ